MIFIFSGVIILIAIFLIKKTAAGYDKQEKEIENILNKEFVRCCYNCEFKDDFNIPYDRFKVCCKTGDIHEKFHYCCDMHEYNDKAKDRAKNIYLFRNKQNKK